jgi:hypothetical protein
MVEWLLKDSWMKKMNRWRKIVDRIKFQWEMHGWLKKIMKDGWMFDERMMNGKIWTDG